MAGRNASSPITAHEVENVAAASNEEQFHQEVVQRDPAVYQIEVACHEDRNIQGLCLERYTFPLISKIARLRQDQPGGDKERDLTHLLTSTRARSLDFVQ